MLDCGVVTPDVEVPFAVPGTDPAAPCGDVSDGLVWMSCVSLLSEARRVYHTTSFLLMLIESSGPQKTFVNFWMLTGFCWFWELTWSMYTWLNVNDGNVLSSPK